MPAPQKKTNPIERLHQAASDIVNLTRQSMRDTGDAHPGSRQLYLPILIAGTDLRVCIEAGPRTAQSNAIQHAQGKEGGIPKMLFQDAVRRAADLLAADAADLRRCSTVPGTPDDWGNETDAKAHYDEMIALVDALNRGR